ncbi:MAG: molybdate ABC transporter substrate-binding protein [Gammaproteobacteria bacterium]|nr:molybdate ABC transporter substrate-binding protein [Gammaproteobacteria bacterium]MDH4315778.1 molybdate ABC transporter substrate-binding protein [Gammaproteobacteria bacterium]MDH5215086.1 molybdate ABC transporter substrate-binding protein [Gammaproteobacteria bacterium]
MVPDFIRRFALQNLVFVAVLFPAISAADSALIAVATNFAEVAESLVRDFEALSEHEIRISTGSTGKLYAQIVNGAPYDALLAADRENPRRLEEAEIAVAGTVFTYAVGKLALWSPDDELIIGNGIEVLKRGNFRTLAIANPELAPYGDAAMETLKSLGLWDALQGKLVMGENVGQAFALVATGNAELGFVALASVKSKRNKQPGSRWDVPAELHAAIRQDAALLEHGYDNAAAVAFLAYLKSDEARLTIASFGYGLE